MASSDPSDDHVLGLTVHSLPAPQDLDPSATRSGRWKMFLVLLLCAAPVVASYVTYYFVRPQARQNFGTLIEPQRPLPDMAVRDLAGASSSLFALKGQWLLISVAGGACDALCQKHLYLQRQLREGLGKEKDRLDWVWLVTDEAPVPADLMPGLATATVLRLPEVQLQTWLQADAGLALPNHLYLVDPLGNWMMRFPPGTDLNQAPKIKRDLERLLRASAFWDTPGR
jgi:nitrate reductase NapE component